MHSIEPYYAWRDLYIAAEDEKSPFYGEQYSEFHYSKKIYNHYIHPQWDDFGSSTLFAKIIYVNYQQGIAILELIGEWNDCLHNDIMFLKNNLLDKLAWHGIDKFVCICENVMNYHSGDADYYEELSEELNESQGWLCLVNLLEHVEQEFLSGSIQHYINFGSDLNNFNWRKILPEHMLITINQLIYQPYLTEGK